MNAAMIIAREFCDHYPRLTGDGNWPCQRCVNSAKSALHSLAGQGVLFPTVAEPRPLSDPSVNTPGKRSKHAADTSVAARHAVMPKTGSQRMRILEAFYNDHGHAWGEGGPGGGWTDDELIVALGLSHQSCGPRRGELVAGGWLIDSGARRPTRSGADAIVWVLTVAAKERLRNAA